MKSFIAVALLALVACASAVVYSTGLPLNTFSVGVPLRSSFAYTPVTSFGANVVRPFYANNLGFNRIGYGYNYAPVTTFGLSGLPYFK